MADVPYWDPGGEVMSLRDAQDPTEWDRIVIDGVPLSAIVQIDGNKDTRLDVKEIPGADGASLTQVGVSPAPITIKLRFLTREALQEWADLVPSLQPKPGKTRPNAIPVYHPALAINGIKSLYLKSIGLVRVASPGGPAEVVSHWVEFLPPTKAGQKTIGSDRVELGGKRAGSFTEKPAKPRSRPSTSSAAAKP